MGQHHNKEKHSGDCHRTLPHSTLSFSSRYYKPTATCYTPFLLLSDEVDHKTLSVSLPILFFLSPSLITIKHSKSATY